MKQPVSTLVSLPSQIFQTINLKNDDKMVKDLEVFSNHPSGLSLSEAPQLTFFGDFPDGLLFDGLGFFNWLNKATKTTLWVATYTVSSDHPLRIQISRLIYYENNNHRLMAKEVRKARSHVKLYLQRRGRKTIGAYTGSQNLVSPTNNELMVKIHPRHHRFLTTYYESLWNQATPNNLPVAIPTIPKQQTPTIKQNQNL